MRHLSIHSRNMQPSKHVRPSRIYTFHQACLKYPKPQIYKNDNWHLAKHEEVTRNGRAKHVALKEKGTIISHPHNTLSVHPVHALTIICTRSGAKPRYPIDPDGPTEAAIYQRIINNNTHRNTIRSRPAKHPNPPTHPLAGTVREVATSGRELFRRCVHK